MSCLRQSIESKIPTKYTIHHLLSSETRPRSILMLEDTPPNSNRHMDTSNRAHLHAQPCLGNPPHADRRAFRPGLLTLPEEGPAPVGSRLGNSALLDSVEGGLLGVVQGDLLGSPGGLALASDGHAQRALDGLLKLGVAALNVGDDPHHELVRVLRHL